ncbi:MAG: guanylate kinase [Ethanoligenens sp.]|uniref:guanylate kinase n=1 Tax=Ethanoligenens sp. TaxID=2099655 RepID=UPI0039EAD170
MKTPERGLLLVVSGPSGSGKGTVLEALFKRRAGLFYSVSATTRAPRPGEVSGEQYYFLSKETFEQEITRGNMLEYARYCDNYYGSPRGPVEEKRAQGLDVILEIEVQGAMKVRHNCSDATLVFIMPPSIEELAKRLRGRGTESEEVVRKRLETSKAEVQTAGAYDYIVLNDEVGRAAHDVDCIITAEKLRSQRYVGGFLG